MKNRDPLHLAGEGGGEGGPGVVPPHLNPLPLRGEEVLVGGPIAF